MQMKRVVPNHGKNMKKKDFSIGFSGRKMRIVKREMSRIKMRMMIGEMVVGMRMRVLISFRFGGYSGFTLKMRRLCILSLRIVF